MSNLFPEDALSLDKVDVVIEYITGDVERFEDVQSFETKTVSFFDNEAPVEYYEIHTKEHIYHIKTNCVKNFKIYY